MPASKHLGKKKGVIEFRTYTEETVTFSSVDKNPQACVSTFQLLKTSKIKTIFFQTAWIRIGPTPIHPLFLEHEWWSLQSIGCLFFLPIILTAQVLEMRGSREPIFSLPTCFSRSENLFPSIPHLTLINGASLLHFKKLCGEGKLWGNVRCCSET